MKLIKVLRQEQERVRSEVSLGFADAKSSDARQEGGENERE